MIKNNGSGLHLASFSLNGEQHFLREQERLKEVWVERILKDSVKVRFGKEVKYLRKR
jgi:hypothetical protein